MSNPTEFQLGRGLDIGTSFIISARGLEKDQKIQYSEFRDAFLRLQSSSPIAKKMMAKGLKGQQYFEDTDGSYIIVGQDAIERAIERNTSVYRPLVKGIISPREKQARRILRYIFKEILGEPTKPEERIVYSVPAQPIDQEEENFDVSFHIDAISNDLKSLGYSPSSLNEGEAVCYSELESNDYSGICLSFGAGAVNVCLMSAGEGIIKYSTSKSGDYIDRMAAQATATADTVVQVEKEASSFQVGQEVAGNPILSAVSLYYVRLIDYTVQSLVSHISQVQNLPKFNKPIPIVLAGGTSRANGVTELFSSLIEQYKKDLPFEISEVRLATNPLYAVARGCFLASQL
jgi:hypothetical protein